MSQAVLVRSPNWVGDAVMSLPFFASLRAALPDASIICLCRPLLTSLYETVPAIDRVLSLDESKGRSGFGSVRLNAARLRAEQFGLAFSLPASFGSALMLWLARIPRRVGYAAEARALLLTDTLPYGRNGRRPHRAEGYLALLSLALPDAPISRDLVFEPGDTASQQVDAIWLDSSSARQELIIAMAPGAAQPNKMWATKRFSQLAGRWIDQVNGRVVFVGAQQDRERAEQVAAVMRAESVTNLAGAGDLPFAAEIIRRADVFVGNDSGLVHLAAAVGTPTVVISGPGDPSEVSPFSPVAVTVKRPLFCSPCYKNTCWRKDKPLECLTDIEVDEVWQRVRELISPIQSSAS
jgi:heptosyltransferase-2